MKTEQKTQSSFINEQQIAEAMASASNKDDSHVRDVLTKARQLHGL